MAIDCQVKTVLENMAICVAIPEQYRTSNAHFT